MSWSTRFEYCFVWCLAAVTELLLRFVSLRRLTALYRVQWNVEPTEPAGEDLQLPPWARQRLRIVGVVMQRWPVDGVCLRESLVAGQRLRKLSPVLRLGVDRQGSSVIAHAWLEINGRSLDARSQLYSVLPVAGMRAR
jgi:hypothetical protein